MVYPAYTMVRTQIYLEEGQVKRLKSAARIAHRTVSDMVREAIDEKLAQPAHEDAFEEVLERISGIWAHRDDLGTTEEYVRRLRRDRRGSSGKRL